MQSSSSAWLAEHTEDHCGRTADLNQYWYSASTIDTLTSAVRARVFQDRPLQDRPDGCTRDVAFLSTPSLYFSLTPAERQGCCLLDYDKELGGDEGDQFVFFDFNHPNALPSRLHRSFACVVIDPPFITDDVWRLYAQAARMLLVDGGYVLGTTIAENRALLHELLGVRPTTYLPSIPNLPYQYCVNIDMTNSNGPFPL